MDRGAAGYPDVAAALRAQGGAHGDDRATIVPDVARPFLAGQAKRGQEDPDGTTYIPEVAYALANGSPRCHAGAGGSGQDSTYIATLQDVTARADAKRQNGTGARTDGIMYTLDATSRHAVVFDGHDLRQRDQPGLRAEADGSHRPMVVFDETQITCPDNRSRPQHDVTHSIVAGGRPPAIAMSDVAAPLTPSLAAARGVTAGKNGELLNNVMQGWTIRYLTPLEQERCMGFPDGWTCLCGAQGDTWRCTCKDGPRQRALGNAVVVPVAEWILRRMREVL